MDNPRVTVEVGLGDESWGSSTIELDAHKAPETAENFLKYVDAGFYDGTIFHRVIGTFMIQGGGYTTPGRNKPGLRAPIRNEAANGLKNTLHTIAMARTSDPHSATAQFFINVADNAFLDHPGRDGWGYCVFGRVISGTEVVDRIRDVKTRLNVGAGEQSQPVEPPVIRSAKRTE